MAGRPGYRRFGFVDFDAMRVLPSSEDADEFVCRRDGGDNVVVTRADIIAGIAAGDVFKVGTPVNNQIGVWTGDGTIEGDTSLTFSGGLLSTNLIRVLTVSEAAPPIAFTGDTGTGIYRPTVGQFGFSSGGSEKWRMSATAFFGKGGAGTNRGAVLFNSAPSATAPTVLPDIDSATTGLGSATTDQMNFIAGALTCMSISKVAGVRRIGFYEGSPIALQTGVAVTTAAVHAALVNLRLITA